MQAGQHPAVAAAIGANLRTRQPKKDLRLLNEPRPADAGDGQEMKERFRA